MLACSDLGIAGSSSGLTGSSSRSSTTETTSFLGTPVPPRIPGTYPHQPLLSLDPSLDESAVMTSLPSEDGIAGRVEPYEDGAAEFDGEESSEDRLGIATELGADDDLTLMAGDDAVEIESDLDGVGCSAEAGGTFADARVDEEGGRRNQLDGAGGGAREETGVTFSEEGV